MLDQRDRLSCLSVGEPGYYFTTRRQKKGEAVKQPMEADFDVQVREGHVEVIFRPTESHISFGILVDPKDIARLGRLSRSATVRHAKTGDTGDYSASEVEAVAFRLASAAISDRIPTGNKFLARPRRRPLIRFQIQS